MSTWGLYMHVPWCRVRCPYCSFHVGTDRDVPWEAYADRILEEYAQSRASFEGLPSTLYIGGGTPSRIPLPQLTRIVEGLRHDDLDEFTIECNPEDLDDTWLAAVQDLGAHRVSLGVQSLHPRHARGLGRAHTPEHALQAMERLRGATSLRSWSADLIFGLHQQSLADLDEDLDLLLAQEPPHVSIYDLTIEPGTPFERAAERGQLVPPSDEVWRSMLERILERLEAAGLHRYEVSNFCRPGHEAQHNRGYWEWRPYLGLGPSAYGTLPDGRLRVNPADTAGWLAGAPAEVEARTPLEAATDRLISGLRSIEGLDVQRLHNAHGLHPAAAQVTRMVDGGLLQWQADRLVLTHEGYFVADAVTRVLVDSLTV